MKPVYCRFEYRTDDDKKPGIQTYNKLVEFPEAAPIAFHALCQPGYHIFWEEKNALKFRILQLEGALDTLARSIENVTNEEFKTKALAHARRVL